MMTARARIAKTVRRAASWLVSAGYVCVSLRSSAALELNPVKPRVIQLDFAIGKDF